MVLGHVKLRLDTAKRYLRHNRLAKLDLKYFYCRAAGIHIKLLGQITGFLPSDIDYLKEHSYEKDWIYWDWQIGS